MDSGPIRVLHVDDEPEFAEVAATFLERKDDRFDVEVATSAEAGLTRLAETDYDCVVSDYDMPREDGIQFLQSVRETQPDLPFVMFTGKGSEEIASEAISAGVTDYLQKSSGTSQYDLLANRITNAVDQYRAQRRAAVQKRQYRELFDQAPVMYVLARDEDGRPVVEDCNDRFVETLGYEREEVIGRPTTDFFTDDSTAAVYEGGGYEEALAGEFGVRERTLVTKDGERIDVLLRASPRLDEDGDIIGLQTLYLDVTERKEREQALRRERDRLAALFENAPRPMIEGSVESTDRYRIVDVNEAFEARFGYEATEIIGRDIADALVPDDERIEHERFRERVAAGDSFSAEVDRTTVDGPRTFLLDVVSYGTDTTPADGWFATFTDITERRDRQEDLELYETMVETVPDGVYALDEEFRYVAVNQGMVDLTGYSKEELVGSHVSLLVDDEVVERAQRQRERIASGGITDEVMTARHPHLTADGETVPTEVRYRALPPGEDGSFRGTAGVLRDITRQQQRERELRRYERIVNTMREAACIYDEDGRYVTVNEYLADFYGTTPAALEGEPSRLIPRIREEHDEDPFQQLIDGTRDEIRGEIEGQFPGQGRQVLSYRLAPLIIDGTVDGVVAVAHEVTEQRERKRTLRRQNDRLERFVSVVSHDLRNPLNVAEGRLELAREECDSEHLDSVARALDRMEILIEDLLSLAREGTAVEERNAVALAAVAERSWRNVETDGARIVVDTDLTLRADESRLQQLLENLFRNSVEHGSAGSAMESPDSGEHDGPGLTITVGTLDGGAGFYVDDDGPGIPAEDRERVFESGYSTSEEGTGFGLSIVDEIADAHGWAVRLAESDDGGARFEITGVETDA